MIKNFPLNKEPLKIKRALISVYDKTGIVDLAKSLVNFNIEIISTGGTEKTLRELGVPVTNVSEYTGFPEIMDGRVKTINPFIEGGILGFRDVHSQEAKKHKIRWIDLVVCNLYPFSEIIDRKDCEISLALEKIDIGMVGIPYDGALTNRPGARHGPREVRNQSSLMRSINHATP